MDIVRIQLLMWKSNKLEVLYLPNVQGTRFFFTEFRIKRNWLSTRGQLDDTCPTRVNYIFCNNLRDSATLS